MFTDTLYTIQNHKEIQGKCSYAVWNGGREKTIYAFDTIGGESTVKAVFASVFGRSGRLGLNVQRHQPGQVYIDEALGGYRCQKETLVQHPSLYRWHFFATPGANDPYLIFFDFCKQGTEDTPAHQPAVKAFHQVMERHTIWPIRDVWAEEMFKRGRETGLVQPLDHTPNIAYAYTAAQTGWGEVLDKAAVTGVLSMPS